MGTVSYRHHFVLQSSQKIAFVYITAEDMAQARKIAKVLVSEKKLAACVNIIEKMRSVYEWEGELQERQECIVIAKSRPELFAELRSAVLAVHSYDCPCIVMFSSCDAHPAFLQWVFQQCPSS